MDWRALFLTAGGRIGRKDFWIGILLIFVVNLLLNVVPILGQLAGLALIYPGVCLTSQRLHDFGRSGWLAAIPYGVGAILMVVSVMLVFAALGGAMIGSEAGALASLGLMSTLGGLVLLVVLGLFGFLLWVGLTRGDEGPNAYGAPPRTLVTAM